MHHARCANSVQSRESHCRNQRQKCGQIRVAQTLLSSAAIESRRAHVVLSSVLTSFWQQNTGPTGKCESSALTCAKEVQSTHGIERCAAFRPGLGITRSAALRSAFLKFHGRCSLSPPDVKTGQGVPFPNPFIVIGSYLCTQQPAPEGATKGVQPFLSPS